MRAACGFHRYHRKAARTILGGNFLLCTQSIDNLDQHKYCKSDQDKTDNSINKKSVAYRHRTRCLGGCHGGVRSGLCTFFQDKK